MVSNCPPISVSTVKICLSAGASLKSGCSVKTILYPKSITINTKAKLNALITKRLVSASNCSVVFCICWLVEVFGTSLRSNAVRWFAIFIIPVFRVLAVVAVTVFAPR